MNDLKLSQLLEAARQNPVPVPPDSFADDTMRAIRLSQGQSSKRNSWLDELNRWFPRLAWGAAMFVALCIAGDYGLSAFHLPSVSEGINELSQQWLFTVSGG